jgi:SAM-dependent methyltransferase
MVYYNYIGVLILISKVVTTDTLAHPIQGRVRDRLPPENVVCHRVASTHDNIQMTRRKALGNAATSLPIILVSGTTTAFAMERDPKTGSYLPTVGEIEAAIPPDWDTVESLIDDGDAATLFSRLDTSPDAVFYEAPRFGEHVDDTAVSLLTNYNSNQAIGEKAAVLDLCSSWTSHIDLDILSSKKIPRVSGLGMNAKELAANPALSDWVVQDLNLNPVLPFDDATFDVVLCQLSIDYLTRPLEVMRQVGRVLKPGGKVHILFSNRLFLSKAVGVWTGADDVDHTFLVGSYLNRCKGNFTSIAATDLSIRKGREKRIVGDPLYVVTAVRAFSVVTRADAVKDLNRRL